MSQFCNPLRRRVPGVFRDEAATPVVFPQACAVRTTSRKTRLAAFSVAALLATLFAAATTFAQQAATAAAPAPAAGEAGVIPTKNMFRVIVDGGPLMYPIALCSFVLLIFVFERFINLRRGHVIPGPFVKRFLEQLKSGQLDREKALTLCEENRSSVAIVFAAAVKKWGRTSVEVEQAILDAGERVTNHLRRHLRLLNGISQVSPLLGLLGTVLGMITSFNGISAAGAGQREILAGGIAQSLLTTAAGMAVAIPALIAYLYFVGRVDQLITEIDSLGQKIVEMISADALDREGQSRAAKAKTKAAA
jgi:biopolymer transport protein ExbB